MDRYDSIIVGGGHNGLVCAAYLAQSGQRVLVLEASAKPGGLGSGREFHPGFQASVAHSISHFSSKVASDLKLASHGFVPDSKSMPTIGLSADSEHVKLHDGSLTGVGADDTNAFREYSRLMNRFADALKPFWHKTMPRIGSSNIADLMTFAHIGLNIRRLARRTCRNSCALPRCRPAT